MWLNEGFASYVEYFGTDKAEPDFKVNCGLHEMLTTVPRLGMRIVLGYVFVLLN